MRTAQVLIEICIWKRNCFIIYIKCNKYVLLMLQKFSGVLITCIDRESALSLLTVLLI